MAIKFLCSVSIQEITEKVLFQANFRSVLSTESKESPRNFLKVVSATFLLVFFKSLNQRSCETNENVFYFTSKVLFVLEKTKI